MQPSSALPLSLGNFNPVYDKMNKGRLCDAGLYLLLSRNLESHNAHFRADSEFCGADEQQPLGKEI